MGSEIGGEMDCRVCGLRQDEPIWGADGQSPTYNICACCGCEFGYEDCVPEGVRKYRESWMAKGGAWFDPASRPSSAAGNSVETVPGASRIHREN